MNRFVGKTELGVGTVVILVDVCEGAVWSEFVRENDCDVGVAMCKLNVCDFVVGYVIDERERSPGDDVFMANIVTAPEELKGVTIRAIWTVERKERSDLCQSISNNRLRSQLNRMTGLAMETQGQILLLVEGMLDEMETSSPVLVNNTVYSEPQISQNIRSFVTSHGVRILYTEDAARTCERLLYYAKIAIENGFVGGQFVRLGTPSTMVNCFTSQPLDDDFYRALLQLVPGIGPSTLSKIVSAFPTLMSLHASLVGCESSCDPCCMSECPVHSTDAVPIPCNKRVLATLRTVMGYDA